MTPGHVRDQIRFTGFIRRPAPDPYSIEISLELPSLEMVIFATPGRATELLWAVTRVGFS